MKTNLEILIDHLQAEFDYLKSSMDNCIAEWDFDGAKAFGQPLLYTRRKLIVLKSLQNPNHNEITLLTEMIPRLEKHLEERKYATDCPNEETRQNMVKFYLKSIPARIEKAEKEIQRLKSSVPKQRIDDDKILELLEALENNEINEVELELKSEKIYLTLHVRDNLCELKLTTKEKASIEHYLTQPKKSILKKLGFSTKTYLKLIPNFKEQDKLKILEELAIIYFEVFGIFGEEVDVKYTG